MIYFAAWHWQILCHLVGLFVCCITIIFIISNRVMEREIVKEPDQDHINDFEVEVLLQMIKEQSETAFRSVSTIIDKEQAELRQLLDGLEVKRHKDLKDADGLSDPDKTSDTDSPTSVMECNDMEKDAVEPYKRVFELAAQGLGADMIAEKMKMARGEIELLFKLRKQFCKAYGSKKQRPAFMH